MEGYNISEIIEAMRVKFFKRIESKTGWGKEQLKQEFEHSMTEVLVDLINKRINDA